jgi:sulfite oxidase
VGARNVKWLAGIQLAPEESDTIWQRKDYKRFSPSVNWGNADFSTIPPIHDTPIQSAILQAGEVADEDGMVSLKGYAYSGGGRGVAMVEVTTNNGADWTLAKTKSPVPYAPM